MDLPDYDRITHRRYNPLNDEWVLVSPHRAQRPWDGQQETVVSERGVAYEPDCYLCPTNLRANGERNPAYQETFVFTNDFGSLLPANEGTAINSEDDLLRMEPESGICRVICYSPDHSLTISRMSRSQVIAVITAWIHEYQQIAAREDINHIQIFENRGEIMGCSNPHPHGQIWANRTVPDIPAREQSRQKQHLDKSGTCLLCDYLDRELKEKQRLLFKNEFFVALVPFWAVWPFETIVLPRAHMGAISSLQPDQVEALAEIMVELGICYDNLFLTSFPYSMGIHQQPTDGKDYPEWHWHMHYFPPLLRSSSVKKHMVGYEMLAMAQRDISPEIAARRLQTLPRHHYRERSDT